ncbi:MAG: hypothetical protein HEQ19_07745 [Gloeotrichia echinulata CP02]
MEYKIISSPVGARHCRALTSVLDSTDNRYIGFGCHWSLVIGKHLRHIYIS